MELRQLSYFIKLAETLNFSTAARELFITQSTLSHQILQLEREFDQALFLRNRRPGPALRAIWPVEVVYRYLCLCIEDRFPQFIRQFSLLFDACKDRCFFIFQIP